MIGNWGGLEWVVVLFSALFIGFFIKQIGEKIVVLNIIGLLAVLQWLLAPLLAYTFFNEKSDLATLWQTVMPIPASTYFSYVLPATISMVIGLNFPAFGEVKKRHTYYIARAKAALRETAVFLPPIFIFIGFIFYELQAFVPVSLRAVFNFASLLSFVAVLYAAYAASKWTFLYFGISLLLLLRQVIQSGMFGSFVFWVLLYSFFFLLGKKARLVNFVFLGVLGVFGVLLIQSIKGDYRKVVWKGGARNSDAATFYQIAAAKLAEPATLLDETAIFWITTRMNQGAIVARTMRNVPAKVPYAGGETIVTSIAAAVVPRLFWPNKPEAGGRDNVARFLKDKYAYKRKISYNIGPVGEAYANFGRWGGCVWMFCYGLIFRLLFLGILAMCKTYPTLVLWIPFLFVGAIKVETDLVSTLGSILKGGVFVFALYFFFYQIVKIKI